MSQLINWPGASLDSEVNWWHAWGIWKLDHSHRFSFEHILYRRIPQLGHKIHCIVIKNHYKSQNSGFVSSSKIAQD